MRKVVVGGVALIVLLLAAGTFCTVGSRSHYTCLDCGLYFQDRVMFGFAMPIHERRSRTDWYDRRIGAPHVHRWSRSSCTAGLNLWQSPTTFACGRQEPLVGWDGWVMKVLARLERLDLDVTYHRELTHPNLDHREAAAEAWK